MYDIVVDATDNVATRYLLSDACVLTSKPLVSGSALRFEGQVVTLSLEIVNSYSWWLWIISTIFKNGSSLLQIGLLGLFMKVLHSFIQNFYIAPFLYFCDGALL